MGEALDMLRFAALSSSVHADAVQCLVDDTQRALSQMTVDNERLNALEASLFPLIEKQKRLEAMRKVVTRARGSRCSSEASKIESDSRVEKVEAIRTQSPCTSRIADVENILHFASSALDGDDILMSSLPGDSSRLNEVFNVKKKKRDKAPVTSISLSDKNGETSNVKCQEANLGERSIEEEVQRVKMEIAQVESMSIKTKLRKLESLKQEVNDVDVDAIFQQIVAPFSFPSDVEALWTNGSGDHCSSEDPNVINALNIDLFVSRACERFTGRYEDALDAIGEFPTYEKSDPVRVFGSLQYAEAMTDASNCDTNAVQELQGAQRGFLVNFYKAMRDIATVSLKNTSCGTNSVLGSDEFNLLPSDWQSSHIISVPNDALLPPARHILTPRFSFSDANELKSLQTLRVDFQREVLASFTGMTKALNEMNLSTPVQEEEKDRCDSSVSLIRVLADSAMNNVVWTTLAQFSPH